jgi:hypothetical protein
MSKPEREATHIMQALDLIEATKGDGYAISRRSFHGDSSLFDDGRSTPRLEFNNIRSSSSDCAPCNEETSSGSGNGFENLVAI